MTSWHSYPKIYNIGHAALIDFLKGPVVIQEKVDGSQFSFGRFGDEIKVRSKGVEMDVNAPEKMFSLAVTWVKENAHNLKDGYTYRGEYFQKSKHNTLAYDRIPTNHIILFDINDAEESYLLPEAMQEEAKRIGLETVPLLFYGGGEGINLEYTKELLNRVSCLGGQKIEGVVIKNYTLFGKDKKVLMGKHVSEAFKEVHAGDWKERNPNTSDILTVLISALKTPSRWDKAVQYLKERGELEHSPKDIGKLMIEVKKDTLSEEKEYITKVLLEWAIPKIERGINSGIPEWYKDKLLASQFEAKSNG